MLNPTMSGVDEMDDATASVVVDNKMKTVIKFPAIVHGNLPPKSVSRVNPIKPDHKKHVPQKNQFALFKLAWWKLYLDICSMYYTEFVTWLLKNLEDAETNLARNCNAGVASFSLKGYHRKFQMWVNKNGMANLLYIPLLGEEGYRIEHAINKEWVVTTPQGVVILSKRYTGLTKGMPYIDMRECKEGFGIIQTVRKNFDNFTGKDIDKA